MEMGLVAGIPADAYSGGAGATTGVPPPPIDDDKLLVTMSRWAKIVSMSCVQGSLAFGGPQVSNGKLYRVWNSPVSRTVHVVPLTARTPATLLVTPSSVTILLTDTMVSLAM